jgi:hypothetical protein
MSVTPGLLPLMTALVLIGCDAGESTSPDEAFRAEFRENAVRTCLEPSRSAAPAGTEGLDWQRICGCAADNFMAGKRTDELRTASEIGPSDRPAVERCAREMKQNGEARPPG